MLTISGVFSVLLIGDLLHIDARARRGDVDLFAHNLHVRQGNLYAALIRIDAGFVGLVESRLLHVDPVRLPPTKSSGADSGVIRPQIRRIESGLGDRSPALRARAGRFHPPPTR